jgi:hypothetical protein
LDVFLPPQGFSEFAPMVPLSSKVSREQRRPWFIEQSGRYPYSGQHPPLSSVDRYCSTNGAPLSTSVHVVPCIEEYALIIRVDEAKAWDSFGRRAVAELTDLRVILFRKQKNIDSIHIDKGSIGRRCRCGERGRTGKIVLAADISRMESVVRLARKLVPKTSE